ncbi:ParB/RepB/Spo0J family partition protein [Megasphaera elsdenii]|uniref:ParB/RepB/Spo0J family partition protein n=1 Tax=Megasphaera elsdenii TaxID=907 RepID=UPI00339A022C
MSILTDLELMPEDKQDAAHEVKYINVGQLVPNPDNFYHIGDLSALKVSILTDGGVRQNLIVEPQGDGTYMIISGHRRCQAVKELLEAGEDVDVDLPCQIERNHAVGERLLFKANSTTRVLTPWEEVLQAQRADEVITRQRKEGLITEPKRQAMQKLLGKSSGDIARLCAIYRNLIPELQQKMQRGKLRISAAYELCQLHPEDQQAMLEAHNTFGLEEITLRDVRSYKNMNGTNLRGVDDPRQTSIMDFIGDKPAPEETGADETEEIEPQEEAEEPETQTADEGPEDEEAGLPEETPPVEAEAAEKDLGTRESKSTLTEEQRMILKEYQTVARSVYGRLCHLWTIYNKHIDGRIDEEKYIDDSQYECNRMYQELDHLRTLDEQMSKKAEGKECDEMGRHE